MVRIDPDPSYKPTSDRIPNLAAGGNHSALYFRRARPEASRPRGDASTKQKAQCGKQLIGPPPNPVASIDFPTPPLWHKEVLYDRQNGLDHSRLTRRHDLLCGSAALPSPSQRLHPLRVIVPSRQHGPALPGRTFRLPAASVTGCFFLGATLMAFADDRGDRSNDQNLWMCFGEGEPSRRMI